MKTKVIVNYNSDIINPLILNYPNYERAESVIEEKLEKLKDAEWSIREVEGSTSKSGMFCCWHARGAKIDIKWEQL